MSWGSYTPVNIWDQSKSLFTSQGVFLYAVSFWNLPPSVLFTEFCSCFPYDLIIGWTLSYKDLSRSILRDIRYIGPIYIFWFPLFPCLWALKIVQIPHIKDTHYRCKIPIYMFVIQKCFHILRLAYWWKVHSSPHGHYFSAALHVAFLVGHSQNNIKLYQIFSKHTVRLSLGIQGCSDFPEKLSLQVFLPGLRQSAVYLHCIIFLQAALSFHSPYIIFMQCSPLSQEEWILS